MTSVTFMTLFRQFHRTREICTGLLKFSPAAAHAGHHTCRTTQDVRNIGQNRLAVNIQTFASLTPAVARLQHYHVSRANKNPHSAVAELENKPDFVPVLNEAGQDIATKIEASVMTGDVGRLFAVVHIASHQRKITQEDLLLVEGDFMADVGDRIRLEKVLMVGNKDFTMTGRPLLSRDLVRVEATVIEKTLSHVRFSFNYIRRKRFRKFKLRQCRHTVLVINSIDVNPAALIKNNPYERAEEDC